MMKKMKSATDDRIHLVFDDYVSCNHYETNIEVINDIYEALRLYIDTFGEFGKIDDDMARPMLYARLPVVCLEGIVLGEVDKRIEEKKEDEDEKEKSEEDEEDEESEEEKESES